MMGFAALITNANAQIGIRVGANLASTFVHEMKGVEYKIRPGFSAGIFYEINNGRLTVQPEIIFAQQGTKREENLAGSKAESNISMNYIQIHDMIKYRIGNLEGFNFFLQAGPYLGIGIGKAKTEACLDGKDCKTSETEYGSNPAQIKNPDFGIEFGAGININKNLSIDARFISGLSNLDNSGGNNILKNTALNFGLGYSF